MRIGSIADYYDVPFVPKLIPHSSVKKISGGIGFKIPSYEAVVEYRGRRLIFHRSRRSIIEVAGRHRPRRSI